MGVTMTITDKIVPGMIGVDIGCGMETVRIAEKEIDFARLDEKLSKKEKRKMDQARRQTWGDLNPVTRKPENSKAFNRRRAQAWKKDLPSLRSLYL